MGKIKSAHYALRIKNASAKIAFVTDLHNTQNGPDNEDLLRMIEDEKPDLVLCGGDMIIGKPGVPTGPAERFLERLCSLFPVVHGVGNHELRIRTYPDQYRGMYEHYRDFLTCRHIPYLENDSIRMMIRGVPFAVFGLDPEAYYYNRYRRRELPPDSIRSMLGEPDPACVNIMLAHTPLHMQSCFQWGADLTLCGHYHGGIMRFGMHRGLISPDLRPFPGKCYGLFEEDGRYGIVSSGAGEHTIPLRIRNPREAVFIDIGPDTARHNGG